MLLVGLAFLGLFLALVSGAGVWGVLHFAHKQATPATVEMVDNTLPTEAQISVVQGEPAHEVIAVLPRSVPELLPLPEVVSEPKSKFDPFGPLPAALVPMPAAPLPAVVRQRVQVSEDKLRRQLADIPEVGLPNDARTAMVESYSKQYRTAASLFASYDFDPFTLLTYFPKAAELPIRFGRNCVLGPKEAAFLGVLGKKLHAYLDIIAPRDQDGKRIEPTKLRQVLQQERRGQRPEWLRPEALPAMIQVLMAEEAPLRLLLVDIMSDIDGRAATVALAERAVFDLSPDVRQAAIEALRFRPREFSRLTFVNALRYPWAPAAENAADALIALDDREAAPLLVAQLGKANPAAPYGVKNGAAVREIVRIHHEANCLLCHTPAFSGRDPVVGSDPLANRPVNSEDFTGKYGGNSAAVKRSLTWQGLLVRADVQFLRQDFSLTFPIGPSFAELQGQRFDFVIRTRMLKPAELRELKSKTVTDPTAYPQREATLRALCALTGKDVGPTTEAWVQLYPNASADVEGTRISNALQRATSEHREQLLAKYRDSKDEHYTEWLANAIGRLSGKVQAKARAALSDRLYLGPVDQLRLRLEDPDEELRHAAAIACIRKTDKEWIPEWIGLLLDTEPEIAEGAHKTLQRVTGEDFGPVVDAPQDDRLAAAAKWEAWRRSQAQR
jgi:hypothetical protein